MKFFAISAIIAGGLAAGALGAAASAHATEFNVGPNGGGVTTVNGDRVDVRPDGFGVTAPNGGGFALGLDGVRVWLPDNANGYERQQFDYDPHYYAQHYYDTTNRCYPNYCVR